MLDLFKSDTELNLLSIYKIGVNAIIKSCHHNLTLLLVSIYIHEK